MRIYPYREFIEDNFVIDESETGKLVPFKLFPVQNKYYEELVRDYDIEANGIRAAIRDQILKARRLKFTSLILGLFAVEIIKSKDPVQFLEISYKDDATRQHFIRMKTMIGSYFRKKGIKQFRDIFKTDNKHNITMIRNGAGFYVGTASGKVGERGGTVQGILFSEEAHYPNTEIMKADEIVTATMQMVDISSGWIFRETTANGYGNSFEKSWHSKGRFRKRFYGWREGYTIRQFQLKASEFTDKNMVRQEYPETAEEAFIMTGSPFFDTDRINELLKNPMEILMRGEISGDPYKIITRAYAGANPRRSINFSEMPKGSVRIYELPDKYSFYVAGGDVAEGIEGGDNSVLRIINNRTKKLAAKLKAKLTPDEFAKKCFLLGMWYNQALMAVEVNKDGLWVNSELVRMGYPNIYFQEILDETTRRNTKKFGWKTDKDTRPLILSELQIDIANTKNRFDKGFLNECLTFVRNKFGRPEAIYGKHDDEIMAEGIARFVSRESPSQSGEKPETEKTDKEKIWDIIYKDMDKLSEGSDEEILWG